MKRILISCVITLVVFSSASFTIAQISQINILSCDDFRTQPEAQAKFASGPIQFAVLDPDFNGRACESLPPGPELVSTADEITEEINHLICGSAHQGLVDWIHHQIEHIQDDEQYVILVSNLATKESQLGCRPSWNHVG